MSRSRSDSPDLKRPGPGPGPGGGGGDRRDDEGGGGGGGGDGRLVTVTSTRNLVEAEMIKGLLADAGIPSVVQRSVDNPDFLAAGPRDVKVVADLAPRAREILMEIMTEEGGDPERMALEQQTRSPLGGGAPSPERLAIWIGAILLGGLVLAWILYQLG